MLKTTWWALLGMMIGALALHLVARAQRRRAGRPVRDHETGGIIVTIAMILIIVAELLDVDTLLAQVLLGVGALLTVVSFWFIIRAFRRPSRVVR